MLNEYKANVLVVVVAVCVFFVYLGFNVWRSVDSYGHPIVVVSEQSGTALPIPNFQFCSRAEDSNHLLLAGGSITDYNSDILPAGKDSDIHYLPAGIQPDWAGRTISPFITSLPQYSEVMATVPGTYSCLNMFNRRFTKADLPRAVLDDLLDTWSGLLDTNITRASYQYSSPPVSQPAGPGLCPTDNQGRLILRSSNDFVTVRLVSILYDTFPRSPEQIYDRLFVAAFDIDPINGSMIFRSDFSSYISAASFLSMNMVETRMIDIHGTVTDSWDVGDMVTVPRSVSTNVQLGGGHNQTLPVSFAEVEIGRVNDKQRISTQNVLFGYQDAITATLSLVSILSAFVVMLNGPGKYSEHGLLRQLFYSTVPTLQQTVLDASWSPPTEESSGTKRPGQAITTGGNIKSNPDEERISVESLQAAMVSSPHSHHHHQPALPHHRTTSGCSTSSSSGLLPRGANGVLSRAPSTGSVELGPASTFSTSLPSVTEQFQLEDGGVSDVSVQIALPRLPPQSLTTNAGGKRPSG